MGCIVFVQKIRQAYIQYEKTYILNNKDYALAYADKHNDMEEI